MSAETKALVVGLVVFFMLVVGWHFELSPKARAREAAKEAARRAAMTKEERDKEDFENWAHDNAW